MTGKKATRRRLHVRTAEGVPVAIGEALWRLEEARQRTLETVTGLTALELDREAPGGGPTIGSLLYHVALVEADWLYVEILEGEFPAELRDRFPLDARDEEGRLTRVLGVPIEEHLDRLADVRGRLRTTVRELPMDEYRRERRLESYDVSPAWVLFHLADHEAQHRGQILALRRTAAG